MTNLNSLTTDVLVRSAKVSPEAFGIVIPANVKASSYEAFPADNPFSAYIPDLDSDYVFEATVRRACLMWINYPMEQSLWLNGPTGCGKSSIIEQIASRFNWPLVKTTAFPEMDISTQIGGLRIVTDPLSGDTKTEFVLGSLAMAYKYGMIYLLDEYDQLESSCANAFNAFLEGGALVIPETGEVIKKHKNFRFVATANSFGQGDSTGVYGGVKMQNSANLDRFMFVSTSYMPEEAEIKLVQKLLPMEADASEVLAKSFVSIANKIRTQFIGTDISGDHMGSSERLSVTCSTRSLKAWVRRFALMRSMKMPAKDSLLQSFDFHIGNRAPHNEKVALTAIVESVFGDMK